MRMSDYECPKCGGIAWEGKRISTGEGIPGIAHLKLSCFLKDHPDWGVDTRCPNCGKVPEYIKMWKRFEDMEPLPALRCCGKTWTEDEVLNPFLDERNI